MPPRKRTIEEHIATGIAVLVIFGFATFLAIVYYFSHIAAR